MLIHNISKIYGVETNNAGIRKGTDMSKVDSLENAWVLIDNGRIADFGSGEPPALAESIDANGKVVTPAFVDCHTHLVFAAGREGEFVDRIKGLSYEQISARGGGILNSARKLAQMSEEELFQQARERLKMVVKSGTGAIEIKSGYGLDVENELKMLRVARRLGEEGMVPIKTTFLGAHAVPASFKGRTDEYVDYVIREMLPEVAREGLADYIDVFCEDGYFDVAQTRKILEAGNEHGLRGRIHVNQFHAFGGVQLAQQMNALSVEHLEVLGEGDLETLNQSDLMPVSLPACSFFLSIPYTPAREIIDAGCGLVLASDFNPGSSPVFDLNFVFSLACVKQRLLPGEAFNALTINAAHALEMEKECGSIAVGKRADLNFYEIESLDQIPYYPAFNQVSGVMRGGSMI